MTNVWLIISLNPQNLHWFNFTSGNLLLTQQLRLWRCSLLCRATPDISARTQGGRCVLISFFYLQLSWFSAWLAVQEA